MTRTKVSTFSFKRTMITAALCAFASANVCAQEWSIGAAFGQGVNSSLLQVIPNAFRGDFEFAPAYLNALLIRRELQTSELIESAGESLAMPISTSVELFAAKAHGIADNSELAIDWRPAITLKSSENWSLDFAWGLGITHSFGKPWSDFTDPEKPEGYRTLFHMAPELAIRSKNWSGGLRIHHASGIYGVVAPQHVGWNYLVFSTLMRF